MRPRAPCVPASGSLTSWSRQVSRWRRRRGSDGGSASVYATLSLGYVGMALFGERPGFSWALAALFVVNGVVYARSYGLLVKAAQRQGLDDRRTP